MRPAIPTRHLLGRPRPALHSRLLSTAPPPVQNEPQERRPSPSKLPLHYFTELSNSVYLRSLKHRLQSVRSNLSHELAHLPSRLSQITGYGEIDKLKALVAHKEADLAASRAAALDAKTQFNLAAQRRAESVKEVNDLLGRKASWSDQDLARFTMLVRTDHSNEQAESEAKKILERSESQVDHQFTSMMQAILTRYHEEQVWSDKIRALSTTFSLSITVINVLVFLAAIVLVEPYKRFKVVSEVEERIIARDSRNSDILDRALSDVVGRLSATEQELSGLLQALQPAAGVAEVGPGAAPVSASEPLGPGDGTVHDVQPPADQEPPPPAPLPLEDHRPASWSDRLPRLDALPDNDLLLAVGIGSAVGVLAMASFQLFAR